MVKKGLLATALFAVAATVAVPAQAEGQNKSAVTKTKKAAPCPSGWGHKDGNTDACAPLSSSAPKVYAKDEGDSCADGYFEVYRVWCSTKRP